METTRQSHVRAALKHARTRLLTLSAFRKVVEDYDLLDTYYGYDMDLTTMDSLERQPSAPASSTNLGRSGATAEEEALAKKHGAKCYVSRGILAEPPQFTRNSRGVVVRSGGPNRDDFTRLKLADLRAAYALSLLENDMNRYRHLYYEGRRKAQVEGRLKFYVCPPETSTIPDLWLADHSTIVENIPPSPPKDLNISRELAVVPDLQEAFFQLRKHQVDMMPARRKTAAASPAAAPGATGSAAAPPGKLPASALPGKGAVAALKATQAQKVSEASQPPAVAPSATQPPAASPPGETGQADTNASATKAKGAPLGKLGKGPPPGKPGKGPPQGKSKLPPPKK
ncbi:hypothetical protein TGDOM2_248690 [Toxoplasma gondii GAB2-2007-GAL-DOM2]|uniref:Uncharacterized protein n=6 Tax=Toxoplasma gondii TaxID=5811 RepID=A0A0F7VF80_TOXGV|nr:hypothetical protein TGGT1_248690 [Toxoplasma gondii GT1]KAF4638648.1 hypothetical protein TGRH88_062560 [Toxoplasma gondii]KFG46490.1 hypothetical protein TGDOM2_248690 [Toxoplasma gondii GAB2-2007-GAL-DOM2]KFG54141.1 hypothetical protein TGFOU_248690 [Toxoplasma gondii FOU]RQX72157.1 hypothetical protein TGCAST_248690 [Toxoplasma gondii CAST]CEL78492.1 TPA: hypothetical protein BN1205_003100 [Toxoplasma gondii VEG]